MRKRQKIFLVISIVALLICSTISVFAALPAYSTGNWIVSTLLSYDDVTFLCEGLLAQLDLQVPMGVHDSSLFFMTVEPAAGGYQYKVYTQSGTGLYNVSVNAYFLSDGSSAGFDGGMYVSLSGSCTGMSRFVDMSLTGGISNKCLDVYFNKSLSVDGTTYKYCYKLSSSEILIASTNSAGDVTLYRDSSMFGTGTNQTVRDMAQSWIDARNVKRDGLSAGGGTLSPEEVSSIYQDGYNAGEINGYIVGHEEGESQGKNIGYQDGYAEGYTEGYNSGKRNWHMEGYSSGYSAGYTDGYSEGFSEGYETGYMHGAIMNPQGTPVVLNISSIITSITSSVGNFFTSAFDIELFGINIAGLLSVLIICAFVFIVIRLCKGGGS